MSAAVTGCVSVPEGTTPVSGFKLDRYLGRWYEIARLDHRFESGLDCVTADYSRRPKGGVRVVNRGVELADDKASQAVGKAYFVDGPDIAAFKVSFFGPFYAGYNVLALDPQYRHALVAGSNRNYLWLLSRQPTMDPETRRAWVDKARKRGFPVDDLVYPKQGSVCTPYRQTDDKASGIKT
ncbi:lipocalin family protein [Salinisphaera sp. Q1T1-3]|uniref:lipocalin family protein n=1 Tax=Salinisphaera sp. Q1T1-3 TaxID=2321229 RepID=UPI000E764D8F|nr:lipocalin family protein [Salinisphaera sp. Q1T1-3]RJS92772.1 lipocalin [Salinisphaera sp. Q1T1-3]